jgi:hypothetical protein
MEAGQHGEHRTVPTGESISVSPEPKTSAEYKAAIHLLLREIRRLFSEMDQNQAEIERKRAEIELLSARSDAALQRLRTELELLRATPDHHAERAD